MTTAVLLTPPKLQFLDSSGAPLAGGKIYTYVAGGFATPKTTYTDQAAGTPNANPVVLDSAGMANIWINGSYGIIVKTSADVTMYSEDNITSFSPSSASGFADNVFSVTNSSDATKVFQLALSGITTGTTITMTVPNRNFTPACLAGGNTLSGAQIGSETTLTSSGASIATDLSLNNNFKHTMTENTTLANPTNVVAGQSGRIAITQHASSPKTMAFGTYWLFSAVENGGSDPALTATNSAIDILYYDVLSSTQISAHLKKGLA